MTGSRILFDTNVVLDALLEREPFVEDAALLVEAVVQRQVTGLLCATTLTTIDYLLGRERNRHVARKAVLQLLATFEVASVGRSELEGAVASSFDDFEDAVLHEAARTAAADAIVTRNSEDFAPATVAVYTPAELRAALSI